MWAHGYPFIKEREKMLAMKPGQRVDKFPGSGYITNKPILSTSGLKNIPKAFKIPAEKEILTSTDPSWCRSSYTIHCWWMDIN